MAQVDPPGERRNPTAGGTGERLCANRGCPGDPPCGVSEANDAEGGEGAVSARPRARDRTRGAACVA